MAFQTPNSFPGPRVEEEYQISTDASDPTTAGAMRYNGTSFRFNDSVGVFSPRPSEAGQVQAAIEVFQTSSASYTRIGTFYFGGSSTWSTPQAIKVAAIVSAGFGQIRVIDRTNGDAVIAENTNVTNTSIGTFVDLGTISNVPTSEAIWEIQALKDTSGTIEVRAANYDFFLVEAGAGGGLRFQANGISGELNITSHDAAPANAPEVTAAFSAGFFDSIRFEANGISGELNITSHDAAPADAPELTGGPWAFI